MMAAYVAKTKGVVTTELFSEIDTSLQTLDYTKRLASQTPVQLSL